MDPTGVVGTKPGREDDRAATAKIQSLGRVDVERLGSREVRRPLPSRLTALVDQVAEVAVTRVSKGNRFGQIRCEDHRVILNTEEVARERDTVARKRSEMQIVPTVSSGRL